MKKLFTIINLILIFFIIDFSISALYKHFAGKLELEMNAYSDFMDRKQKKTEIKKFRKQSYYKNIEIRNLFGMKKAGKLKKKQSLKSALLSSSGPKPKLKLTNLKLKLKGTITGTGSGAFAVIVKNGEKKERLYTEGETIDHAVIKTILNGKVILLVDGRKEILLMQHEKIKKHSKNTLTAKNYSGNNDKKNAAGNNHQSDIVGNISITRTDIHELIKSSIEIEKQLRINPHFYRGEMDGFRITGITKNSSLYKKSGLKNGDIITAVNGKEIKSVSDAMNLYNNFTQSNGNTSVDLKIKRKGSYMKIRYSIK